MNRSETARLAAAIATAIVLGIVLPMAAGFWLMDHAPNLYLFVHQSGW